MDNMEKDIMSTENIVNLLEEGLYSKKPIPGTLSVTDVTSKILEFSQFLNGVGRITLFHSDKSDSEELVTLLLTLKKSVKYALNEIGYSRNKAKFEYTCLKCSEPFDLDSNQNFWTSLQSHEHTEHLYDQFLNGTLDNLTEDFANVCMNKPNGHFYPIPGPSTSEFANENTDSGIDNDNIDSNEIYETDINEASEVDHRESNNADYNPEILKNSEHTEKDVNSFRFNFVLTYDDVIENKIYPDRLMKTIRKYDKIKEYTMQKAGPFRAVCLLCCCDVVTKSKICKFALDSHATGQRHLKFASNPENVENLKKYHEVWLNQEPMYQAHQVYFKPVNSCLKCDLCNTYVHYDEALIHIGTNPHKKKVLDMFEKKINTFFLMELQVQVYGIIVAADKEIKNEKPVAKPKTRKENTDTDSSSSAVQDPKENKHNIIKSVDNLTSENVLDLLPNRFKVNVKYFKESGNALLCFLCGVTVSKNVDNIKKHINTSLHATESGFSLEKYSYFCEICNVKVSNEAAWVAHFTKGPNRHANMAESRKAKTTEYECTVCNTVIYGDELSLSRHLSVGLKREKKTKAAAEIKLPGPVIRLFQSEELIEAEAHKLASEANNVLICNSLTKECCARLEAALSATFEGCKAYPFGSRVSGLGDKNSDFDIFMDTGDMYMGYKNQDAMAQVQIVRKVYSALGKLDEFVDLLQIPTARTPIVRVYHLPTDIDCDLSFRHGLSVENTKFIRFCLDLQPITQSFILLLKKWSQINNFSENIAMYALYLMAIFYLQVNNYLLSVRKLRELNPRKPLVINGWETINYTMPLEEIKTYVDPYPHSVSKLLKDFFAYYAKFNYSQEVICPLMGHTIPKNLFLLGTLPEEMKAYLTQLQGEEPEEFRTRSSICIQDPFDLSHNLSKACGFGVLNKFKTMCDLTFKHLNDFV
ncbi:hypothetical protein NQ315_015184 [Exocentrus adspersus]|uniref:Uncharacterized protein n=1 Tax=Exocentrus adspersus TaxID=1586481 RepID=A0AAV8VIM2_9CUCU|nr:hypothetical protein NQ315_015184 [Exocentrus adspersus]